MEGLHDLIDKCTNKEKTPSEQHAVREISKNNMRMGWEMHLTTETGEYEMDQVILDLGFDVNVLPK